MDREEDYRDYIKEMIESDMQEKINTYRILVSDILKNDTKNLAISDKTTRNIKKAIKILKQVKETKNIAPLIFFPKHVLMDILLCINIIEIEEYEDFNEYKKIKDLIVQNIISLSMNDYI